MNIEFFALFIRVIAQLFIYVVIASALLSFILPPYHPIREALDRIVNPFMNPIRSIMPQTGMFDFSPLILILLVDLLSRVIVSILLSI